MVNLGDNLLYKSIVKSPIGIEIKGFEKCCMLDIVLEYPHGVCSIDDVSPTAGHINVDSIFQVSLKE